MTLEQALLHVFGEEQVVVIGAAALEQEGLHTGGTLDFDVAVPLGPAECRARLEAATGWAQSDCVEYRWTYGGRIVDVLPVDDAARRAGVVEFKESDRQLNVVGFRLAFAEARPTPGCPGLRHAAPFAVAVLKMAAYLDRPSERQKDLSDLAYLFWHYVNAEDDRLYEGEPAQQGIWGDEASTYCLGVDIGVAARPDEARLVHTFVDTVAGDNGWHRSQWVRGAEFRPWADDEVLAHLEVLARGVDDGQAVGVG